MSLKEDGLRAFGAWEPLAHTVRMGGRGRPRDLYDWMHTEDFIKGLRDRGFSLYITHFSKGYGIEAEAEERENTRKVVDLCHKHGLHAAGYIRYTTFIPDTLKNEIPDCIERFGAFTSSGKYARYGTQYWRYMPCPSSQEFLEYIARLIDIGLNDVGLDGLHIDGMALRPEPLGCHCPRCAEGFRAWLNERYPTTEERKALFGLPGFGNVRPPEFDVHLGIDVPQPAIKDPMVREWTLFRCRLLGKAWKFIVGAARKHKPDVFIQGNPSFYPGLNVAWLAGMRLRDMAEAGSDGFFTEEGNAPDLTKDGRLHGYFESFKKLRRLGFQVYTYNREPVTHEPMTEPERLKRGMAHQMAFNLDSAGVFCGLRGAGEWPATVPEYMAFHRERRDLFRDAAQAHDVAIYHSEVSRAFNAGTPVATSLITCNELMRAHVPFGFLLEWRREELSDFRAVILPESECMAEDEADDIAAYVRGGGGLLVIGANTGTYDERRRAHRTNVLQQKLGIAWLDETPAFTARVGGGRVAFLPGLLTPDGTPEELVKQDLERADPYMILSFTDWHRPLNGADLVNLLRWTAGGSRFDVTVPDTVVVEFCRQENPNRFLVHLVNYDLERDVGPFEITCNGIPLESAEGHSPDGPVTVRSNKNSAIVEGFHRYAIICLNTGG